MLHGVQLWVALPDADRNTRASSITHVPEPVSRSGSPLSGCSWASWPDSGRRCTPSPRCWAPSSTSPPGRIVDLDVDPTFEHGVLLDLGAVEVAGRTAGRRATWPTWARARPSLRLHNPAERPARVLLLGGAPFGEDLLMWWNFVGRSHDEIVDYRRLLAGRRCAVRRRQWVLGFCHATARTRRCPTTRLRPRRRRT